jgi:hypothetical protein
MGSNLWADVILPVCYRADAPVFYSMFSSERNTPICCQCSNSSDVQYCLQTDTLAAIKSLGFTVFPVICKTAHKQMYVC